MTKTAHLFVISGPSGAGKGTVLARLLQERSNLGLTVSATTRSPRPGEIDGKSYYFMSDEEFMDRVSRGDFLEWASVHGHHYGTLKAEVDRLLAAGSSVVLEIDPQGAFSVRESYPDAVLIFIEPPSMEVLEARLRGRATESEAAVQLRLEDARREMMLADRYDVRVVNDQLDTAVQQLALVLESYETNGGLLPHVSN